MGERNHINWEMKLGGDILVKTPYRGRRVNTCSKKTGGNQTSHGKREASKSQKHPGMLRLTICAVILFAAVMVKILAPDTLVIYREKLLQWMGEQTDLVSVFSSVGRIMGGEVEEALNDAYVAVFGPQEVEEATSAPIAAEISDAAYTEENTPALARLQQEVLGFSYTTPVKGTLTDRFGYRQHPVSGEKRFHYGLDLAAEEGSVIASFAQGIVTVVGDNAELGKYVEIAHANGYSTLYAHCSKITASSGQTVAQGDPIAEVGQTGQATGPHLHFEIHHDNMYVNPIYYVECT